MRIISKNILVLALMVVFSACTVSASSSVIVSAVVGSINQSPLIVSVNPASDPKLLGRNKLQNYAIYFSDAEKNTVYYTITPTSGSANPTSGTINPSDYDTSSGVYINFSYLSPATIPSPNPTSIVVTLNDGPNLVNKTLRVNVY